MIREMNVDCREPVVLMGTELVYCQLPFWCNASFRPLTMSLLRVRSYFDFDPPATKQPVIVFLCGGGWAATDPDVWMPEMTFFAKNGFAVASVRYSVSGERRFPSQIIEIRQAIRYLRAHADELRIDPDRIAIMGESGGGHLAAITALSSERSEFDNNEYSEYSSAVSCAVIYYAPVDILDREGRGDIASYRDRPQYSRRGSIPTQELLLWETDLASKQTIAKTADPRSYITSDSPPFLLLYGTGDIRVPIHNGDAFYDELVKAGVPVDYLRFHGARHGGAEFFQQETKQIVLDFLCSHLPRKNGREG